MKRPLGPDEVEVDHFQLNYSANEPPHIKVWWCCCVYLVEWLD
jgi:hypothetical protein